MVRCDVRPCATGGGEERRGGPERTKKKEAKKTGAPGKDAGGPNICTTLLENRLPPIEERKRGDDLLYQRGKKHREHQTMCYWRGGV